MSRSMSVLQDETRFLWQSFMPRKQEITSAINNVLYSLQIYPSGYFANFKPEVTFEKWALVEVERADSIPAGMEAFTIPAGLYAVFHYKGPSSDKSIFQYIYGRWLPSSDYRLDDRPHFEVLGERYSNTSPDSEEDIWIPIQSII